MPARRQPALESGPEQRRRLGKPGWREIFLLNPIGPFECLAVDSPLYRLAADLIAWHASIYQLAARFPLRIKCGLLHCELERDCSADLGRLAKREEKSNHGIENPIAINGCASSSLTSNVPTRVTSGSSVSRLRMIFIQP
jgi:hypothetical protein